VTARSGQAGIAGIDKKKKNSLGEQFISHSREMRESPAWRHLPDKARRVLDRLELEHMRHGGAENGALKVTYDDFKRWGIKRRNDIALAIRQCEGLGFLEVTERGGRSISDQRWPSQYRLTYALGVKNRGAVPTHEWRRVSTDEMAITLLKRARQVRNHDTQPQQSNHAHVIRFGGAR
jgi:hypothetical protein